MSIQKVLIFLLLLSSSCTSKKDSVQSSEVEVIKFSQLNEVINQDNGKVKIINFWATWCKPCVKEMPHFEALLEKYGSENIEMTLVSFDFVEELEKKVIPFVKKKNLKSKVMLLDETDYNSFIDKVDKNWSGAIPATLMIDYRNDKRAFFEKEFRNDELEKAYITFKD